MEPRSAFAALAILASTLLSAAAQPAQAQTTVTPLIPAGRLALPGTAFGRGGQIMNQHIDRTAQAVNNEVILANTAKEEQQGSLYRRHGASASLFEHVVLPGTTGTGGAPRFVHFMATAFPTTSAAQAAWRGDTSFLGTHTGGCTKPDLVAVQGRYSTAACQISTGTKQSYIEVTALRGNVEFVFYVIVFSDQPASLLQVQGDASTIARAAFGAYGRLPVHRGPTPANASSSTVAVSNIPPTATPIPAPASTPVPAPTQAPVSQRVSTYQASIAGATVTLDANYPKSYTDGSTSYSYSVAWVDGGPQTISGYILNVNNPSSGEAAVTSAELFSSADRSFDGGTLQTSNNGSSWSIEENGNRACRVTIGGYKGTTAYAINSNSTTCGSAASRNQTILSSLMSVISA